MKKILFFLFALCLTANAQKATKNQKSMDSNQIKDKLELKELVDTFSILADQKKIKEQVLLFTENAEVVSIMNGKANAPLIGRKNLEAAFSGFLNLFETVYHLNGQQTVKINGNSATGTSYCQVTLIGAENGKKMKTTFGVIYNDSFIKQNNKWLIEKRTSNFTWQDKQELGN